MTRKLLITSATALLAGTVLAAGQDNQRSQPGATQEHQAPQGQGQREQRKPAQPNSRAQDRVQDRNQGQRPSTTGQGQRDDAQGAQPREQNQSPNQRREGQDNRRDRTQGQGERDRSQRDDRNRRDEGQNQRDQDRRQGQDNRDNRDRTQGQGPGRGAGASVTFTTEQRTKIRETVLVGGSAPRITNVNFKINVGVAVPRAVHVVTVPDVIVEIHPTWRGFLYFVYEDEIVIVDPRSHKIVAVLDV